MMKKSDVKAAVAFIIQGYLWSHDATETEGDAARTVIQAIAEEIQGWIDGAPIFTSPLYGYLRPGDIEMLLTSLRDREDPPTTLITELEELLNDLG